MRKHFIAMLTLAIFVAFTGSVWADPITGINTRPITLGTTAAGEISLQEMLNQNFGTDNVSAANDQQTAGVFKTSSQLNPATFPILQFEQSGLALSHTFGVWTAYDTAGPITTLQVFAGTNAPGDIASLIWDNTLQNGGLFVKKAGTNAFQFIQNFAGINANFFGFYYNYTMNDTPVTLYSYDALNSGFTRDGEPFNAAALTYKSTTGSIWKIAFDDLQVDWDYNDFVVRMESVDPVPLPGAVLLLGAGMVRLVAYARRRREE
jgi:hypothetical protein